MKSWGTYRLWIRSGPYPYVILKCLATKKVSRWCEKIPTTLVVRYCNGGIRWRSEWHIDIRERCKTMVSFTINSWDRLLDKELDGLPQHTSVCNYMVWNPNLSQQSNPELGFNSNYIYELVLKL